ncbi:MAG: hypothetical protein AB2693_29745 [Candidatus Thiodiazotropha sp.]
MGFDGGQSKTLFNCTFDAVDPNCFDEQMIVSDMTHQDSTDLDQTEDTPSYSNPVSIGDSDSKLFDDKAYRSMLSVLQNDEKSMKIHDWLAIDSDTFMGYFMSKISLEKHFQKHELSLCLQAVNDLFQRAGIYFQARWPKYRLVEFILEHMNDNVRIKDGPMISKSSFREQHKVTTLKKHCIAVISKFSKEVLPVI